MFKVTTGKRQFTHDVPILTPVDDGGFSEDKLKTTFNWLDIDEAAKYDVTTRDGTDKFLDVVIETFHELTDADDKPLVCDAEVRRKLLARQNIRQGVIAYYFDAIAKVKTGN